MILLAQCAIISSCLLNSLNVNPCYDLKHDLRAHSGRFEGSRGYGIKPLVIKLSTVSLSEVKLFAVVDEPDSLMSGGLETELAILIFFGSIIYVFLVCTTKDGG